MPNVRIKDQTTDTALTTGDYVIVDSESEGTRKYDLGALAARVEALEQGGGGTGLTQEEKDLILELFAKAAYADDDAALSYTELETLWTIITRSVSLNLSHVTSSNQSASVEGGSRYTTTLTADTNYTLNSVTVTMGGVDITSTAYSSGTITIPSVTGNIVITATAVLAALSITATYTQSGTVYDTDSLDSLKSDLVVTANYSGGTSETVPASNYTLSGTLTVGTSTITVTYAGLTDTFNVTVTSEWDVSWDYTMGLPSNNGFTLESTESADPIETIEDDGLLFTVKGPSTQYAMYFYNTTPSQSAMEIVFKSGTVNNEQHFIYLSTDSNNNGIGLRCQYSSGYKGIYLMTSATIGDMTKLTNFALETQYKIKIEVANNLANIYVNDELVAQDQTLYGVGASNTRLRTSSAGSGSTRVNMKLISMKLKHATA